MVDYTITLGPNPKMKVNLKKTGLVGRFKPLHLGAGVLLEEACEQAEHLTIGIGSCNKYNLRNPFTADESEAMIKEFLTPKYNNFTIIKIPDFAHIPEYADGNKWRETIKETFGNLDFFITGNDYVTKLLCGDYRIMPPFIFIPKEKQIKLKATLVRVEMARYGDWKSLMPEKVAHYLEKNGLVDRFREEFGLQTLASLAYTNVNEHESDEAERAHTLEV
jgi:nicotinamide mononucleotide adenylyltransferase